MDLPETMYPHTFLTSHPTQSASEWSLQDDKAFEEGLLMFSEELPDRWQRIAHQVGKSVPDVQEHYESLVHHVCEIESGRVPLPRYVDDCFESDWDGPANQISFGSGKSKHGDGERKKGTPWTEEEHRLFLLGLKEYGKGDWRSISRKVVISRTPTQVASHAQKYFLRRNSVAKKERKRSSIHDITTVDNNVGLPVNQSWIPQPGEQVQHPQTMQTLPHSEHFPSQEGLIPSSHLNNEGQGRSLGYPNFNFPM